MLCCFYTPSQRSRLSHTAISREPDEKSPGSQRENVGTHSTVNPGGVGRHSTCLLASTPGGLFSVRVRTTAVPPSLPPSLVSAAQNAFSGLDPRPSDPLEAPLRQIDPLSVRLSVCPASPPQLSVMNMWGEAAKASVMDAIDKYKSVYFVP